MVFIYPPDAFRMGTHQNAYMLYLVHNHPGGSLVPPAKDRDLTDRFIKMGEIMGIRITDYLIITTENYYSFMETGLLEKLEKSRKYALSLAQEKKIQERIKEERRIAKLGKRLFLRYRKTRRLGKNGICDSKGDEER